MSFRSILIPALLITTFALTSCVREFTCQCRISYSGVPGLPDTVVHEYPIKDTKKKAETLCEQNSTVTDNNGIHTVEKCSLY